MTLKVEYLGEMEVIFRTGFGYDFWDQAGSIHEKVEAENFVTISL